jgi:hypothetical protein
MNRVQLDKLKIWEKHIEEAESFAGGYCKSQGLNLSTYYHWRDKLSSPKVKSTRESRSSFLPVVVASREHSKASPAHLPDAKWVAEVMTHLIRGLS